VLVHFHFLQKFAFKKDGNISTTIFLGSAKGHNKNTLEASTYF